MIIRVKVKNKHAQVEGTPIIVCGNSDYSLEIDFDREWDSAAVKTARFVYIKEGKAQHQDVVFTGDTAAVPVLSGIQEVRVGFFSSELRTTTPAIIPCDLSIRCGTTAPDDYTPSQYDQIIALLNDETVLARMNDLELILDRVPLAWQNGNVHSGPDNQVLSAPTAAIGYKNQAGGKAYKLTGAAPNGDTGEGIFTLATVDGLEAGLEYRALRSSGRILQIVGTEVYVDGYSHVDLSGEPDDPEEFRAYDYLTIIGRPDLGDTDVGFTANASGRQTIAQDAATHAEGDQTVAAATGSHAEGRSTKALGEASHAEGQSSRAAGFASHAEGQLTKASGTGAHAEGYDTRAEGHYSHAEGLNTKALGRATHAQGVGSTASGEASSASGYGTTARRKGQSVVGTYNAHDDEALFIVGNGTDASNPSNALAVRKDGSLKVGGRVIPESILSEQVNITPGEGDRDTYNSHDTLDAFLMSVYNEMEGGDVKTVTIQYTGALFNNLPVLCTIHRARYEDLGLDYGTAVFVQYDTDDGVRTWSKCCVNGKWNATVLHNSGTNYTIRPRTFNYGMGTLEEVLTVHLDEMENGTLRTFHLKKSNYIIPNIPEASMDAMVTMFRSSAGYGYANFECYNDNWTETVRFRSTCYNGKWQPMEYENPPMHDFNVEYRTTERHLGQIVYTRLLDLGTMPNASEKTIVLTSIGIKRPLRVNAYMVDGDALPAQRLSGYSAYAYLNVNSLVVGAADDRSAHTGVAQIWYTKN